VDFCFSSFLPYASASSGDDFDDAQLIIRTVELKDIKGLTDVLTHSFHPRQGLWFWLYPLLKLGISEDLRSRLRSSSPHYRCLVASKVVYEVGAEVEEIVGTAEIAMRSYAVASDRSPYISNLAVSQVYRRRGIARQLLNGCERVAREWGCQYISLHVLEDNHSAKQLYFTSGYQLHRIECSLSSWLFKRPRRLLLRKKVSQGENISR
jgi:ribosomal protein S18 acetylase RimI-like enzyme